MSAALLENYAVVERAAERMLAAARRSDWDEVARIEHACYTLVQQLQQSAEGAELDGEGNARRMAVLKRILAIDGEVRDLAQPWLKNVDTMFKGRSPFGFRSAWTEGARDGTGSDD